MLGMKQFQGSNTYGRPPDYPHSIVRIGTEMFFPKKIALLATLGILATGCSSSNGPTDRSNAGSPTVTDASRDGSATPAAVPGVMRLTADELKVVRTASISSCNIEALGKTAFDSTPLEVSDKSTTVGGWVLSAISRKSGVPAQLRVLNMAGTDGWQLPIESWVARPDVISAMHAVDSGNVGFSQAVDFRTLPVGIYRVLVTFEDTGQGYSCDKGRMIKISDGG